MAIERTLSIIKPDATARNITGEINKMIEDADIKIIACKRVQLTKDKTEGFYAEHKGKPFFEGLVDYMITEPVVLQVLEGENVITAYRDLMGATNPLSAKKGTIRNRFGSFMSRNCVHGSDSAESAKREIEYFFDENEILP